jgi:dTDP-4-amino-4,6-dideoxygalactose transaminase
MIEHSKPTIGKPEKEAVLKVIDGGIIYEGNTVEKFENKLAETIGSRGAVAASTGTQALHLALLAIRLAPGDEIIIPNYVCRSVLNAVLYCGARPVLCDVDSDTYNIDFERAKKLLNRKTRAVIVAHMFGLPAEISRFRELGVYVIEDCAHSIGAKYHGRRAGSFGDLSVFSFEGTKYITTGEGGAVLANSAVLLNRLRRLKEPEARDCRIKYTSRMTNIQAAIGCVQLDRLPAFIKRRREIAAIYNSAFSGLPLGLPKVPPGRTHIFQRYMVKLEKCADKFMAYCFSKGVKVKRPVKPLLLNQYLGLPIKDYPCSRQIMRSSVSIPVYPSLTEKELRLIITTVKNGLKS